MSDARRAADLRLAEGKITAEEHTAILAKISGFDAPIALQPSMPVVAPDMPSDKLIWQGGAGGAVFALMGLWLWSYRADELAACRANPIMIADTCHVPALGAVVVGVLLTVGAIGICVAVAMAWQKANQAAKV